MGVLAQPHPARSDDAAGDPRIKHIIVLMMETARSIICSGC